ncbi:hypothetical protein LCGC14_2158370, partial [marine sediment metagenome]
MPTTLYVDNGTELITDQTLGIVGTAVTASGFYIGWGTGGSSTGGTATNTDVDLEVPATEARVSCTDESESAADTAQWIGTLQTTTVKTIEESGLFIDATGTATDMLIRANHGGVVMATDDQIEYTYT